MTQTYKKGDLVAIHREYHPSIYFYCRILKIIDENHNEFNCFNVTTGEGDLNSKVKILLNPFSKIQEEYYFSIPGNIEYIEHDELLINPHSIMLLDDKSITNLISDYENEISKINNKISFLKENSGRSVKLKELIVGN